jgi:hypothetical protein
MKLIRFAGRYPMVLSIIFVIFTFFVGRFLSEGAWEIGRYYEWPTSRTETVYKIVVLCWFPILIFSVLLYLERALYLLGLLRLFGFSRPYISTFIAKIFKDKDVT